MTTANYGWPTPADTDLVKDGAAAIRALGDAIDDTVAAAVVPVGAIVLWSGAIDAVPDGWALCDGSNGTPNLRDRFVVGAGGQHAPGATGGQASVSLTTAQLPAHAHAAGSLATGSAGLHSHTTNVRKDANNDPHNHNSAAERTQHGSTSGANDTNTAVNSSGAHTHSVTGSTASVGSGAAVENRPPYWALAYIMRIA